MTAPPGGLTETSPGQTDRVKAILARRSQTANDAPGCAGAPEVTAVALPEPDDVLEPDEVLEPVGPPLTAFEAEKLDNRLKWAAKSAARDLDKVAELAAEAKRGRIHVALGFPSWTAYLADRLAPVSAVLTGENRREVVTLLAGEGMSLRAIAGATGTSKDTVARDLAAAHKVSHDETPAGAHDQDHDDQAPEAAASPPVTGMDGKTHQTKPRPTTDPSAKPRRRAPFGGTFTERQRALDKAVVKFCVLADDDRFDQFVQDVPGRVRFQIDAAIVALAAIRDRLPEAEAAFRAKRAGVTYMIDNRLTVVPWPDEAK